MPYGFIPVKFSCNNTDLATALILLYKYMYIHQ